MLMTHSFSPSRCTQDRQSQPTPAVSRRVQKRGKLVCERYNHNLVEQDLQKMGVWAMCFLPEIPVNKWILGNVQRMCVPCYIPTHFPYKRRGYLYCCPFLKKITQMNH